MPEDRYTREAPSIAATLDLFAGQWSSRLPGPLGALGPGTVPLFEDDRIGWLLDQIGGVAGLDVLELGPLEAGHTYMLERAGAAGILSIESNSQAYLRCLVVKELLELRRAQFLFGDFMPWFDTNTRHFDLSVASGVLYHMVDPIGLLARLSRSSDRVFLWTHYYDHDVLSVDPTTSRRFPGSTEAVHDGFRYVLHRHNYLSALDLAGFCGGSEPFSQWLSRDDILGFLDHAGFSDVRISHEQRDHPHGPCFCVLAQRATTSAPLRAATAEPATAWATLTPADAEAAIVHHRAQVADLSARVTDLQARIDHVTSTRQWQARQRVGTVVRRARAALDRRSGDRR